MHKKRAHEVHALFLRRIRYDGDDPAPPSYLSEKQSCTANRLAQAFCICQRPFALQICSHANLYKSDAGFRYFLALANFHILHRLVQIGDLLRMSNSR